MTYVKLAMDGIWKNKNTISRTLLLHPFYLHPIIFYFRFYKIRVSKIQCLAVSYKD